MTIGKAKQFIRRGMQDKALRGQLVSSTDRASLSAILEKEGLLFSDHDFDEAFHNLLTQCQFQDQADQLMDFGMWWRMILAQQQN